MGLDNVPNVGWVSFFLRVEEKNKINSFKFALSYQKAKSCLFLIKRYRIYLVVCRSYTCCQHLYIRNSKIHMRIIIATTSALYVELQTPFIIISTYYKKQHIAAYCAYSNDLSVLIRFYKPFLNHASNIQTIYLL